MCVSASIHLRQGVVTSLVPRPFEEEEKGPGTHCVCMRYFPSKSWEFVFLSAYLSVNVNLDLRCMPKKIIFAGSVSGSRRLL